MMDFIVAFEKLAGFQTSDEIANYFMGEGIQGYPQEESACPIAKWMQQTTNEDVYVDNRAAFIVNMEAYPTDDFREHVNMSPAMMEFVDRFDGGDYPELSLEWQEELGWDE